MSVFDTWSKKTKLSYQKPVRESFSVKNVFFSTLFGVTHMSINRSLKPSIGIIIIDFFLL